MEYPNFIEDTNPFRLAGPPSWFQRQLWEFDPSLVIVPSRQGFYYRLAQRRKIQLADKLAYEALKEQADTSVLMRHGLVPVTTILATVNWSNPAFFWELERRAPWRMGGADKVNAARDAADAKDRAERQAKNDQMIDDLAKDSWKYYALKTGRRTSLFSHKAEGEGIPQNTNTPAIRVSQEQAYKPTIYTSWGGKF